MAFNRFQWTAVRAVLVLAAAFGGPRAGWGQSPQPNAAPQPVVRQATPEYKFSPEDDRLLNDIERGCFNYLWNEVGGPGRLAQDRRTVLVASLAGVGYQLSSLPIGVERGWITREEGQQRALDVLHTLQSGGVNRHQGVFLHFVTADFGTLYRPYDNEISTVDHALFLAGAMPAATYFGGEVAAIVNQIAAATNWREFQRTDTGYICFGWDPDNNSELTAGGQYKTHEWTIASDEEHLIYFIAAGCPTPEFAVDPRSYYLLRREFGQLEGGAPYVLSWNGALFTYFFSHCYIPYRDMAADNPAQFGVDLPGVDWFENSRRATLAHRAMCQQHAGAFRTLGENRWGLSPCMGQAGDEPRWDYIVPEVEPNLVKQNLWHRGTVAPYAAGSAIMFTPAESLAALREFRNLEDGAGKPLVWRDPARGGYAFADSFNLDQGVACDDNVAIDAGPMLLAIENARSGLIWRLFMEHEHAKRAFERLKFAWTR